MRKLLHTSFVLLIAFFCISPCNEIYAQKRGKEKEKDDTYNFKAHPDFDIDEIPEKWQNESAVIICEEFSFKLDFKRANHYGYEKTRKKIKLLDKGAVDNYSEFYYSFGSKSDLKIRIIKPDGKKVNIPQSDAIEIEGEVPARFRGYSNTFKYKKLAIPNLEVGDIIEYIHGEKISSYAYYSSQPYFINLRQEYPTMKFNLKFELGEQNTFSFVSSNTDATLEKIGRKDDYTKYLFTLSDIDKFEEERWQLPATSDPMIKFQIYDENSAKHFLDEKKAKLPQQNIPAFIENNYLDAYYRMDFSNYADSKNIKDKKDLAIAYFYFYRYKAFILGVVNTDYRPGFYISNDTDFPLNEHELNQINSKSRLANNSRYFVEGFTTILKKFEIPYQIGIAVPKAIGDIKDMMLPAETVPVIVAKIDGKDYFFNLNGRHGMANEISYSLEGTEAYVYNPKSEKVSTLQLPVSDYNMNKSVTDLSISFDGDSEKINVIRKNTSSGHNKNRTINTYLLPAHYAAKDFMEYHDSKTKFFFKQKINAKFLKEAKEKDFVSKEIVKKAKEKQLEWLENGIKNEYETEDVEYEDYKLIQSGRYHDKPEMIVEEKYTLNHFLQKAGSNIVLPIGKFLGGQVKISEEEKERDYDIYQDYPRSFITNIELEIPDNYEVANLDQLNNNIDNEAGAFISSANQEGNTIKIKAEKIYKNYHDTKDKWPLYIEFLEPAYDFSHAKIVLKEK